MRRSMWLILSLAAFGAARADAADAKPLAQEILDKGSALFDTRDAAAMAATYTDDGQILWYEKDNTTGDVKLTSKRDRAEIEALYRELFKGGEKTTSRNVVEFARFVTPDLLIVAGAFQPDVAKDGKFAFVQVRTKQGDRWLIKTLEIFVISQE